MDGSDYPDLFEELMNKWLEENKGYCCWYDFEQQKIEEGLSEGEILYQWEKLQEEFDETIFSKLPDPLIDVNDLYMRHWDTDTMGGFLKYIEKIHGYKSLKDFIEKCLEENITDDEIKNKYMDMYHKFYDYINNHMDYKKA